jgi:hypothetical protein
MAIEIAFRGPAQMRRSRVEIESAGRSGGLWFCCREAGAREAPNALIFRR